MPLRPSPNSLKEKCTEAIAINYELICYGCRQRNDMNRLLDSEGGEYKNYPGPFVTFPSHLLEDLIEAVKCKRGLPKESLHQLMLPQLLEFKVHSRASRHIQTNLLAKFCHKLKHLNFSFCKSIQPLFYTKFLRNFPQLVILNLESTIIDNEAMESVGTVCVNLRELNITDTTITDSGLSQLISTPEKPRCVHLISMSIDRTRISPSCIAQFLISHRNLMTLNLKNMSPVFSCIREMATGSKIQPVLSLQSLAFNEGAVEPGSVSYGTQLCPFTKCFIIRQTDLSETILSSISCLENLATLHLGNSAFTQRILNFQDGVVPLLLYLTKLQSLTLEKFNRVDVLAIGDLCPHLKYLKLVCIGSYLPVFNPHKKYFQELEELILLNTKGAHLYTKTVNQLMISAYNIKHLRFQFVDTLNDEVFSDLLGENPMKQLETVIFDQCHSISLYTLENLIYSENLLSDLCVWSCRFITETEQWELLQIIQSENFNLRFNFYEYTGEEAPMPLEDIENPNIEDETESEDSSDEDELAVPEFLNYWNTIRTAQQAQIRHGMANPDLD